MGWLGSVRVHMAGTSKCGECGLSHSSPVAPLKLPLGPHAAPRLDETGRVTKMATPRQARMAMMTHIDLEEEGGGLSVSGPDVVLGSCCKQASADHTSHSHVRSPHSNATSHHRTTHHTRTHFCMIAAECVEARAVPGSYPVRYMAKMQSSPRAVKASVTRKRASRKRARMRKEPNLSSSQLLRYLEWLNKDS